MGAAIAEVARVFEAGERASVESDLRRCPELELARRVSGGDMGALEEVYRRYHVIVYTLCLRMTRNVAEAEDLSQDVFVNLHRALGSFRGEAALSTWIHRVTVNRVLMHFRRASARYEQVTEDGGPPPDRATPDAETSGPLSAERVALEKAVERLPPGYRAVFILHDVEGYEHDEVARLCGISSGTSKSQLHKARMKLRRMLRP
ncbi:MAG: RNA polymerase sigma factor [Acidobacteria bacterium]|nr:RNA polymerase sigma factor [Acidobacteriota bacterium]